MKRTRFILLVVILIFSVAIAHAQDGSNIPPDVVEDSARFVTDLVEGLYNLTYLPFAVTLVVALTAVSKHFSPIDARLQNLAWSVVVWAAYIAASWAGYAEQFESIVPAFAVVVSTFGGMLLTPKSADLMYKASRDMNIPIIGKAQG